MQIGAQKTLKKGAQNGLELKKGFGTQKRRHFSSVNWHKRKPRPEGTWMEIKLILFNFLEIKMRPSSYSNHLANFSNIPTSINREGFSKFNTLFHAFC